MQPFYKVLYIVEYIICNLLDICECMKNLASGSSLDNPARKSFIQKNNPRRSFTSCLVLVYLLK